MSNEFEPYHIELKTNEFSAWEFQAPNAEEPADEAVQETLVDECELLKQQAFDQGYAEGLQKAQAEINDKKKELAYWFDLMQKPIQLIDEKLSQEFIQAFIWLCTHCIGVELTLNPEQLGSLFNEIKPELPSLRANQVLAMHPEDVAWIKKEFDEKMVPGLHAILLEDPSLNRGDFYLKGEHSELDGRLHTRFITLFDNYFDKAKTKV